MRPSTVLTTIGLLAAVVAGSVEGQVVRGRLLDLTTSEPIEGGVLTLILNGTSRLRSVVTGPDGGYVLEAPAPGVYFVEARRLGYRAWIDGPIELVDGDDWETEYRLQSAAIMLDPVEVVAEVARLEARLSNVGFYERQRSDFGHFMGREEIVRRRAGRVTDLLSSLPGVRLVPSATGLGRNAIELRGSLMVRGNMCHPRVFVDGILIIRGDARQAGLDVHGFPEERTTELQFAQGEREEIAIDDVVVPEDILAVEVYRSASQVPVQFGGTSMDTQCGVIVIWTKTGAPDPGRGDAER